MSKSEEKVVFAGCDVWEEVFMILNNIPELTDDEAERIAKAAQDVVERELRKILNE